MDKRNMKGHMLALFTSIIWGSTFVVTKVLLDNFSAFEILVSRFVIAYIVSIFVAPKYIKFTDIKEEFLFAFMSFIGVVVYYLFENISLSYTNAANTSVILSISPFITGLISYFYLKEDLNPRFFIGFFIAIIGIGIISFAGKKIEISPKGDILAVVAAISWSVYNVFLNKLSVRGYSSAQITRRTFFYAVIFFLILSPIKFLEFNLTIDRFKDPSILFSIFYLGVIASVVCYIAWNKAIKIIGPVKSSVYLYIMPIITIIAGMIVLNEKLTPSSILGIVLILSGSILSEGNFMKKKVKEIVDEDDTIENKN